MHCSYLAYVLKRGVSLMWNGSPGGAFTFKLPKGGWPVIREYLVTGSRKTEMELDDEPSRKKDPEKTW